MKYSLKMIIGALFGISLIGCGGGSDDSSPNNSTTVSTGIFVDSPVVGLKYSTDTLSGYTTSKGLYRYNNGEKITFFLGNLSLGTTAGKGIITPLTLSNDAINTKSVNIARILQTLDEGSTGGTTLVLPSEIRDINFTGLDWNSEADLNTILQKVGDKTTGGYILKDSSSSKEHMLGYIEYYNNEVLVSDRKYIITEPKRYVMTVYRDSIIYVSGYGSDGNEINDYSTCTDWRCSYGMFVSSKIKISNDNFTKTFYGSESSVSLSAGTYEVYVTNSSTGGENFLNSFSIKSNQLITEEDLIIE